MRKKGGKSGMVLTPQTLSPMAEQWGREGIERKNKTKRNEKMQGLHAKLVFHRSSARNTLTLHLSASKLHFLRTRDTWQTNFDTNTPRAIHLPPPPLFFSPLQNHSRLSSQKKRQKSTRHKRENQQLTQPFPLSFSSLSSSPTLFLSQSQLQLVRLDCCCCCCSPPHTPATPTTRSHDRHPKRLGRHSAATPLIQRK